MIIYRLAIELKMPPAAIREMDYFDFNRLVMLMQADDIAAKERMKQKK